MMCGVSDLSFSLSVLDNFSSNFYVHVIFCVAFVSILTFAIAISGLGSTLIHC